MRHIYRQVTSLREFQTFVLTRERANPDLYPFDDIESLPKPRGNFLRRFYLKYLKGEEPLLYRGEYQQLMGLLERRDPDLMHVYFGHTGAHLVTLIERWDKPVVVSFHGMDVMHRDDPRYMRDLRRLFGSAALVLARSESLHRRLIELGCPPEKLRLNRTSIPMDDFPVLERTPPEDGGWRIVQTSRLIPKKGLPDTLHAFALFREQYPAARLVIAGEGPLRESLQETAARLGIAPAVEFAGFLSSAELCRLYGIAHLFVHPSQTTQEKDQEGVPNAMLEAMATGLPVVATRHGGIPEAVEEEIAGVLVPERSPEALARGMLGIVGDPERWRALSRGAAESVRRKYSVESAITELESCYAEAMRIGGAARGEPAEDQRGPISHS